MSKLTKRQIEIVQKYFQKQPVLRAYLFGSFVRGEATKNSDVDILVDLDYDQPIGLRFVSMQLELENLLAKKVDLVSSGGMSPFVKPFIESEKQLIYAR